MPRHEISIDVNEAVKELSDKIRYDLAFLTAIFTALALL